MSYNAPVQVHMRISYMGFFTNIFHHIPLVKNWAKITAASDEGSTYSATVIINGDTAVFVRYEHATETDDLNIFTSVKQGKQDTLPFMS
jgi:hypothetical protein